MGVHMAKKTKRRRFTTEFKAEAVRLVRESSKPIAEIARDIDVGETSLHNWVAQAKIDRGEGRPGQLATEELEELRQLRKEVRELRMERDFLKKTAAYFAEWKK